MLTRLLMVVFVSTVYLKPTRVAADFYLTGAQLYNAAANGGVVDEQTDYRYTTNGGQGGGAQLTISQLGTSQSSAISFLLVTGSNTFTFNTVEASPETVTNLGLNLFFTDLDETPDNSYNPALLTQRSQVPGDLSVFNTVGAAASNFDFVSSGTHVLNYLFQKGVNPGANGLELFTVGNQTVTVSGFQATIAGGMPSGSFTLTVTATPEPSTIGFGALAACGLAHWVRKRRKKKNPMEC